MSFKEYEVIAIPNSNTLLINYGINNGAKRGQTLRIIEKGPRILIDEHDYGTYDAIKAIVEIHAPYEQFSECKLFNYSTINVLSPLQSLLKQTKKEKMTLSGVTPTPMPMPPTITPISVGDIAQLTNE